MNKHYGQCRLKTEPNVFIHTRRSQFNIALTHLNGHANFLKPSFDISNMSSSK